MCARQPMFANIHGKQFEFDTIQTYEITQLCAFTKNTRGNQSKMFFERSLCRLPDERCVNKMHFMLMHFIFLASVTTPRHYNVKCLPC